MWHAGSSQDAVQLAQGSGKLLIVLLEGPGPVSQWCRRYVEGRPGGSEAARFFRERTVLLRLPCPSSAAEGPRPETEDGRLFMQALPFTVSVPAFVCVGAGGRFLRATPQLPFSDGEVGLTRFFAEVMQSWRELQRPSSNITAAAPGPLPSDSPAQQLASEQPSEPAEGPPAAPEGPPDTAATPVPAPSPHSPAAAAAKAGAEGSEDPHSTLSSAPAPAAAGRAGAPRVEPGAVSAQPTADPATRGPEPLAQLNLSQPSPDTAGTAAEHTVRAHPAAEQPARSQPPAEQPAGGVPASPATVQPLADPPAPASTRAAPAEAPLAGGESVRPSGAPSKALPQGLSEPLEQTSSQGDRQHRAQLPAAAQQEISVAAQPVAEAGHPAPAGGRVDTSGAAASGAADGGLAGEEPPAEALVQITLLDGSRIRHTFPADATLRAVHDLVAQHSSSSGGRSAAYTLATPYPRRVFAPSDASCTLAQLGLLGRVSLVLLPRSGGSSNPLGGMAAGPLSAASQAAQALGGAGLLQGLWAWLLALWERLRIFLFASGPQDQPLGARQPPQRAPAPAPASGPRSTAAEGEARPRRRGRPRPAVRTLHDSESSGDDREKYWNGNSTQFKGD